MLNIHCLVEISISLLKYKTFPRKWDQPFCSREDKNFYYFYLFIYLFKKFLSFILFIFLYSRFLLVINFIHISVYMSIPIAQFITPPPRPPCGFPPLGVHTFVLYICVSISALQTSSSVPFFQVPHICINIQYLFFSF